ncbi:hypothetical protein, partial [Segeticoccus rhizosphaerae]|uniref:hypothetical protein n=1 Tax=Segeticoccus rhizosphaerae TaxID=1104777 RepID=UPI001EF04032
MVGRLVTDVFADQLMQLSHTSQALSESRPNQRLTRLILQLDVVMVLGPVISYEQHSRTSDSRSIINNVRQLVEGAGTLMNKCSRSGEQARHPISGQLFQPPAGARSACRTRKRSWAHECSPTGSYLSPSLPQRAEPVTLIR